MRSINIWVIALMVSLSYNCKDQKKETKEVTNDMEQTTSEIEEAVSAESLQFSMEPKSGSNVKGVVNITEEDGDVKMIAELSGLSEGEHAIHLHEKADCSSDDGKSTGGHWNPTNEPHGKWGASEGYHKGDIGNFTADADGNATVEFETNQWCIGCEDDTKNVLGKAVIVHEGVDDYTSQPSGDAGTRISCTGIIQ